MMAEGRLDMWPDMFDDYSEQPSRGGTLGIALTGKNCLLVLMSVLLVLVIVGVSS